MNAEELVQKHTLVKMLSGSHAYGTNIATSDVDYRGIFCAEPVNILTPFFPIREYEVASEEDSKLFELHHFMKLCLDCNPNILELLWVDPKDITLSTPAYDLLRAGREKLLCSKVAFTFSGYAVSQLQRIKGHNKWINNPMPEQAPLPCEYMSLVQWFGEDKIMPRDFNIMNFKHDYRLVPYSETLFGLFPRTGYQTVNDDGSLNSIFEDDRANYRNPLAIVKWSKEQYVVEKEKHAQYWSWKKNRNELRSELEEKYGFDSKHAMHLVRLLRMGKEILETGQVIVRRPDAQELLSIRNGAWTYNQLIQYAEEMDNTIRNELYNKTHLPKKPDIHFAARLLMDVQNSVWSTSYGNRNGE